MLAQVRALLDEVGAQAVKVVPLFNRLLHSPMETALQVPLWVQPRVWGVGSGPSTLVLMCHPKSGTA